VFASLRRLNLRLEYFGHGPMSEVPDACLVLPVILTSRAQFLPSELPVLHPKSGQWRNNIVALLESEHYNRICEIYISDIFGPLAAAMQKPFPELTRLDISVYGDEVPILPDSFLGGSAPRLQTLVLKSTPFPSMPKLLLSANSLVTLYLLDSGYISPDAMATALTVMTRLEFLHLGFLSPRSRPDPTSRPLPPSTHFVLPALTQFLFKGVYEYLEDLLARIDAPTSTSFFMDLDFDVPQLHRLIDHGGVQDIQPRRCVDC